MKNPKQLVLLVLLVAALFWFVIWEIPEKDAIPANGLAPRGLVSEILGREESCMQCHGEVEGFSPAHQPENIGCSPCHRGNPVAATAEEAHQAMILVPGNLENVYQTCGTVNCHFDIAQRVDQSLMNTMSGVISVDKFVFGELATPTGHFNIKDLGNSPADSHLRHLCASCHLGNEKVHPGPIAETSRGGGCNACHLNYSQEALSALENFQGAGKVPRFHPALNLKVTNDHCFGCHSRSSRISLNYEGWHETPLSPAAVAGKRGFRVLEDQRVLRFIAADIHHQAGLECIDCHKVTELMGDGNRYQHKEEAGQTYCSDCHFTGQPATVGYDSLSLEQKKILGLRNRDWQEKRFVVGRRSKLPMSNVWLNEEGQPIMATKNAGKEHVLKAPSRVCTAGKAHADLSCGACHTGWAPQCVGCHTEYAPDAKGFDLLTGQPTKDKWVEYLGEFFPELPTLGVVEMGTESPEKIREIRTFIPGMIMTLDQSAFAGMGASQEAFHRLFAPTVAHTTTVKGRSCVSCHNSPLALGYGRGELTLRQEKWQFYPEYADSPQDGLPQDAWIGFLQAPRATATTRLYARPFRIAEQRKILEVGACLTCHDGNSKVMQESLIDYEKVKGRIREACILPEF